MLCTHCQTEFSGSPKAVCSHLLVPDGEYETHHRWFTGRGTEYRLVCDQCATASEAVVPFQAVCEGCFGKYEEFWAEGKPIGAPEVLLRATDLAFVHRVVTVPNSPGAPWLSVRPVTAENASVWIGLTGAGQLCRIDLEQAQLDQLTCLAPDEVDFDQPISLHVDSHGRFSVVANTRGLRGVVVDLETRARTMSLQRGDYHVRHCVFPLAFFEAEGRTLLVHGTDWNRLEVSDPSTGVLLTGRPEPPSWRPGEPLPPHTLDYFHSDLVVSPDQRWIADNGWAWHPLGMVVTWSLEDWVTRNEWESEDGPSRRDLCSRQYFWNGPLCWLAPTRLAVWGFGDDEDHLIPAVRIFDVISGRQVGWFAGPNGSLAFDEVLFSYSPEEGTAVWDVATGERLHSDPSFFPTAYHPGARHFLTLLEDGGFRISHLSGKIR